MKIEDIMNKDLKYGKPEMSIEEAMHLMADNDLGSLPVVENNQVIGVVTLQDLVLQNRKNLTIDRYEMEAGELNTEIDTTEQQARKPLKEFSPNSLSEDVKKRFQLYGMPF